MRVGSLSRSPVGNDIRADQFPVDPQRPQAPASAPRDIRADLTRASLVTNLCAALRDSCATLAGFSFTAPAKNVAACAPRAANGASPRTPAAMERPIDHPSEPPPPYEAEAMGSSLPEPPKYEQTPPVPAYHLDKPPASGIMLFHANRQHGSPPLRLEDLRPGMSLNVWNGNTWDTATVDQMRVAVGNQIHVIDASNSHLLVSPA